MDMAKKKQTDQDSKKKRSDRAPKGKRPEGAPQGKGVDREPKKRRSEAAPPIEGAEQAPQTPPTEPVPQPPPTQQAPQEQRPEDLRRTADDTGAFVAMVEAIPDPQVRYQRATEELDRHQQAVERLSAVRADAAAAAYDSGGSVRVLAQRLGVSPSRVHQLIQDAKARSAKVPE
jgi:DNA-directed RNA polymerase specialized sigma24 family protein